MKNMKNQRLPGAVKEKSATAPLPGRRRHFPFFSQSVPEMGLGHSRHTGHDVSKIVNFGHSFKIKRLIGH